MLLVCSVPDTTRLPVMLPPVVSAQEPRAGGKRVDDAVERRPVGVEGVAPAVLITADGGQGKVVVRGGGITHRARSSAAAQLPRCTRRHVHGHWRLLQPLRSTSAHWASIHNAHRRLPPDADWAMAEPFERSRHWAKIDSVTESGWSGGDGTMWVIAHHLIPAGGLPGHGIGGVSVPFPRPDRRRGRSYR